MDVDTPRREPGPIDSDAFSIPERVECDATVANSVRLIIAVIKPD
jgi:hypothetical protein